MFRGRRFHEFMDDLDRFIDDMTKEVEDVAKSIYESTERDFPRPFLYGFSLRLDDEGRPIIKTFGDKGPDSEYREPLFDQFVDESRNELKLVAELPGVSRESIELRTSEEDLQITAAGQDRKYKAETKLKAKVEPSSSSAIYKNGILEITFKLKDKTNKGFSNIRVD